MLSSVAEMSLKQDLSGKLLSGQSAGGLITQTSTCALFGHVYKLVPLPNTVVRKYFIEKCTNPLKYVI